jgi:tetratricopeptide (TPR) repeat protein
MLSVLGKLAEAQPLLRQALETARAIGDRRLTATVLFQLGFAGTSVGDFAGARAQLAEALRLAKVLGAGVLEASIGFAVAQNEYLAGDPAAALRLIDDVLANYDSLNSAGTVPSIAWGLADKATYLIALGGYAEARVHAKEALERARGLQLLFVIVRSLQHLGVVAVLEPRVDVQLSAAEYAVTARLFGFVEARLTSLGALEDLEHRHYQDALTVLRDALGASEITRLMASGATMAEDEAIEQAHALELA